MKKEHYDIHYSGSLEETARVAAQLATRLKAGDVVAFTGDLGAGKTTFIQTLVKELGSFSTVTSPTFTIINEYTDGPVPIYHFDMYRMRQTAELKGLNFDDYLFGDGICLIEWAEKVSDFLPEHTCTVSILIQGESQREITIAGGRKSE